MSALTHHSIIQDHALAVHGWLDDCDSARLLLAWCDQHFGAAKAWGYTQFSIRSHWVHKFEFLKPSYKLLFDLQFSDQVTIYDSVDLFYTSVAARLPE
jgi:hypothetical protein